MKPKRGSADEPRKNRVVQHTLYCETHRCSIRVLFAFLPETLEPQPAHRAAHSVSDLRSHWRCLENDANYAARLILPVPNAVLKVAANASPHRATAKTATLPP
jgi:hypothetical protein